MKRLILSCFVALGGGCALAPKVDATLGSRVRGPIASRIQHPLALTFPSLGLRRAVAQTEGSFGLDADLSYSTIFENGTDGTNVIDVVRFDGEFTRAALRTRYGFGAGADVTVHAAGLHGGGGSLDDFVRDWHDFFNFPNSGRDAVDDDAFNVFIERDGREIYRFEGNQVGFQDLGVEFFLGASSWREARWLHGARVVVELPTGEEDDGFGNGEIDFGLGWAAERSEGRLSHFVSAAWIHAQRATSFVGSGVDISELFELGYGLEYRWTNSTSLIVQLDGLSPLTDDIDMEEIDAPMIDLALGAITDLGDNACLHLSFHEDVVSAAGPDFALLCGVSLNY